jgi:hypothetical protein
MDYKVGQIVFSTAGIGWDYAIIEKAEDTMYLILLDGKDSRWMNKVLLHLQSRLDVKRSREIKIGEILKLK